MEKGVCEEYVNNCHHCLFGKPCRVRRHVASAPPWDTSSPTATWHCDLLVLPDHVWVLGLWSRGSRHCQFQVMISDARALRTASMGLFLPDAKLLLLDGEPRVSADVRACMQAFGTKILKGVPHTHQNRNNAIEGIFSWVRPLITIASRQAQLSPVSPQFLPQLEDS